MKLKSIAVLLTVVAVLVVCSFPQVTSAQSSAAAFSSASKVPTNIKGVSIFKGAPTGFNPSTATDEELASYGLPARPSDPETLAKWTTAMNALKNHLAPQVEAKPWSNKPMIPSKAPVENATTAGVTSLESYNWSGIANTNKLTKWNNNTSFNFVSSFFVQTNAQPPFGACPGSDGPFYTSTWNGIDGATNGDVVQTGTLGYADCGGPADTEYLAWVEWYPSYPILELSCTFDDNPPIICPVAPGDDFWIITYGSGAPGSYPAPPYPGCGDQFLFIEDITQQWGGTIGLSWQAGQCLDGSSAEYIVERPGVGNPDAPFGLGALANTIFDFSAGNYALDGRGTPTFYPGSQTATVWNISMLDDNADQVITTVTAGNAGPQGLGSLWYQTTGCALNGGCTP
jgi:hypothetical protein